MTKEEIKQIYSMTDILSRYGLTPNRSGFICCPFHSEKTASLKIYPDSFHCFGCGLHGDIFTFVQRMEGLSFADAFRELGGTYENQDKNKSYLDRIHSIRDRKTEADKKQKERDSELHRKRRELREAAIWAGICASGVKYLEPFSDDWCFCANEIEPAFYRLEMLMDEVWKEVRRGIGQ